MYYFVGILVGLNGLVRGISVVFPVLWVAHLLINRASWKKAAHIGLLITVGMLTVLFPYGIRNYIVSDEFHMTSTNSSINFWMGNNELATGGYINPSLKEPPDPNDPYSGDKIARKEAWQYIRDNLDEVGILFVIKLRNLYLADGIDTPFWVFRDDAFQGVDKPGVIDRVDMVEMSTDLANAYYRFLLVLGVGFLVAVGAGHPGIREQGRRSAMLVLTLMATTGIHLVFI